MTCHGLEQDLLIFMAFLIIHSVVVLLSSKKYFVLTDEDGWFSHFAVIPVGTWIGNLDTGAQIVIYCLRMYTRFS